VETELSVIVLAFWKKPLLDECLDSVDNALSRVEGKKELLVVVNGLAEDETKALRGERPQAVVVEPGRNLGFAGGVASALEYARGRWIAVINDDCVLAPEALREMLAAGADRGDVGAVAAQIRFASRPETINCAGIEVDTLGVTRERLLGMPVGTGDEASDVFGASGAAALYRRRMLDALGGFDESFFAYLEDADLAWRGRMQGWRCVYAPRAVVLHRHSASLGHGSSDKHYLVGRNRVRMLAKNATPRQLGRNLLQMVVYDAAYVLFVAVTARTLSPLHGRLCGLREWRRYRQLGSVARTDVPLARASSLRAAMQRNRAYHLAGRLQGRARPASFRS
jgi:GT2 family glycosyltransferase